MKIRTGAELNRAARLLTDEGRIEWLESGGELVQWNTTTSPPRDGSWFLALVRDPEGSLYRTPCHNEDGEWIDDDDNELWMLKGWAPLP